MAANPNTLPQAKLGSQKQTLQVLEPKPICLKQSIRDPC
jgi:hypothetical protein